MLRILSVIISTFFMLPLAYADSTVIDTTVADFSSGTIDASGYISQTANGEVLLLPTVGNEFSVPLPASWSTLIWNGGGSVTVGGGTVTLDGARVGTTALYTAGSSVEFTATFSGAPWQHVGFGTDFNGAPFAIFSTKEGGTLYARTNDGAQFFNIPISGSWFNASHRYRIDWNPSSVVFFIDGVQVSSQTITISQQMRPLLSDYVTGDGSLTVDWLRMSPYNSPAIFPSRIFDAGQAVTWGNLSWTSTLPSGTSLTMSVRTGNTSTPDGSWSTYTTIPTSGAPVNASARYLQYHAQLSTSATTSTPVLQDVTVQYSAP